MRVTNRSVWITTSFVGFHKWNFAPDEVAYLRHLHRHLFKVTVEVEVNRSLAERVVEFHMLKTKVDEILSYLPCADPPREFDWSCEQIAEQIANAILAHSFPTEVVVVNVSEDGECGARIRMERTSEE